MSCLFCNIVDGKTEAKVVLDEPDLLAFEDINPVAPTHVLVVPKQHLASLAEAEDEHEPLLGKLLLAARKIAADQGLDTGFRTVINSGPDAGQTVFHLHVHVLGGRQASWPPG